MLYTVLVVKSCSSGAAPACLARNGWKFRRVRAYAVVLGIAMAASLARAQVVFAPIVSVSGVNNGVVLGPANGNAVVDIQFSLSQEFNNVSIGAPLLGASSNSVANFYLTTQVGPGTTSADAIATNTGVALAYGSHYSFTTIFSGLDLKAGTYNLVCGGASGSPTLGYAYPLPPYSVYASPNVSYSYSSTLSGATYAPASTLSPSTVAFNFQVTGDPVLLVGSAAGSSSVDTPNASLGATSNSPFLHVPLGAGSTQNSVLPFTYDAFTGTGTRTGTLSIGGVFTVTVVQAGANYIGPGPALTLVSSGLNVPVGVAVDGAGNVYVTDQNDNAVKEWSAATQQVTTLVSSGLSSPQGTAVDASGNVYIADFANNEIKEWNASTHQVTTLVSSGLNGPYGVAVDAYGDVYIADANNNAIKEWSASTQQVTTLVSSGLHTPLGVAVDDGGNVYIADFANSEIKEWNASTYQVTTLVSSGLNGPYGVAVDGSGDVYIADANNNAIKEWSASTQQVTTLVYPHPSLPLGVAVDGSGNLYIADADSNAVKELPYAFVGPASLTEPATAGSDSLLPVLPSTAPLSGIFAPTSDQSWLTIGTVANGVVDFSFTANTSITRVAHITVLGQQITVTQPGVVPVLTVTKTHTGNFAQGQNGATYSVTASNAGAVPSSGAVTMTETVPSGLTLVSMAGPAWTCPSGGTTCTRGDALAAGASYPAITVTVNVAADAPAQVTNQVSVWGGDSATAGASDLTLIDAPAIASLSPSFTIAGGGPFTLTVNGSGFASTSVVQWNGAALATTYVSATQLTATTTTADLASPGTALITVYTAPGGGTSNSSTFTVIAQGTGLQFFALTPCRVLDTRSFAGFPAPFGPPYLAGNTSRSFPLLSSTACSIPSSAVAYSLNITAVPSTKYLGWITVWPTGQAEPVASTLNAWSGLITANAAIVPAGTGGAISVYASDPTDVFMDIDGYFAPPQATGLDLYPLTPCRVADTRGFAGFPAPFGPPSLPGAGTRAFPVLSGSCGIPTTAVAYSLNMTAAPSSGYLGWLTTWPSGTPEPVASTLNAWA
jgi:sugar lactone lactonase YvrE